MSRWEYFSFDEFKCKGSGENRMELDFIDKLDRLRDMFGYPIIISSGYRSPSHNKDVSNTGATGPHTTGRACDIRVDRLRAWQLLACVFTLNYDAQEENRPPVFSGVGINQKGDGRFIHLDDLSRPTRPTVWTY